ncbi:neurofilament light polypeptide-like [Coffea eugenioides]|uniref:neurofilament light polypeptide-like n=1 Tax=Coffea eugenioides TaxID=49369 RepID=UPI000F615051|nr:neurofilament light polypeptide-like [Coffea eugenioides]
MVTTASQTAFVAEMTHRYCALIEEQDTGKLQDQIAKLKKKLVVSESEKSELQRRLQEAETKGEEAEATINSFKSALEEEQKKAEEVKKTHEQALESARTSAVEDFRRSETFIGDLGQLTRPSFMLGFTSAIDEAAVHLSSETLESLRNNANYNEDSKELCDRMADGIQVGRNLAEVQDEFNKWLSELDEVFEEDGGEDAGGDVGEKADEGHEGGGEGEPHPGGEETGEAIGQEGAETGV